MEPTNEYGVPLSACNGYRHDEHYWCWIKHRIQTGIGRIGIGCELCAATKEQK